MPYVRRGYDGAKWLQVLKTGIASYVLSESLAKYRRHEGASSNNKVMAVKRVWYMDRKLSIYLCHIPAYVLFVTHLMLLKI